MNSQNIDQAYNPSNNPQGLRREEEEDDLFSFIDFRKLLSDVIRYWWVFVLSVAIVLVGLKYYHMYTTPIYTASATLVVDNNKQSSARTDLTSGVALGTMYTQLSNQIQILKSRWIVEQVVEKVGNFVSFYHIGTIKDTELFPCRELVLVMDSTHAQPLNVKIYMTPIDETSYNLKVESEVVTLYNYDKRERVGSLEKLQHEGKYFYGQPVITPWCAFTLLSRSSKLSNMYFVFEEPEQLITRYRNALSVQQDLKGESSVVTLSITGTTPRKNELILNSILQWYIDDNLNQKNEISENTIRFIDEQLVGLSDSLARIGTKLTSFRSSHGIIKNDISEKGKTISEEIKDYETEKKSLNVVLEYYQYLRDYFKNDSVLTGVIAPATYPTNTPIITEQLNNIMQLNAEKQKIAGLGGTEGNPAYNNVMVRLHIARNTLLNSVENQKQMTDEKIKEIDAKLQSYYSEMMSLPETERKLLGIDREYSLNSDVYNFLMRKRSEAQIQKASNTPDHKILDAARTTAQVKPNIKQNQTVGLVAAIALPLLLILLRQIIDTKIRTAADVKKATKLDAIAEIPNNHFDTVLVVKENPKSNEAEAFRQLKQKVDLKTMGKKTPIIALTSSVPGDGKTFSAINLASVYSLTQKKTVLLGFDLRKPGLTKDLKLEGKQGITDYLIGECSLEDITVKVGNLDVIGSGTIPPNPAELIESEQCMQLIETLKTMYDVIVIDTPPVGLVIDPLLVAKWADAILFVVRQDYTNKSALKYCIEDLQSSNVNNFMIVMNDINNKKSRYGYGYGYGGYGRYGKYGKYGKYGYGKYGKYGYGKGYGCGYYSES